MDPNFENIADILDSVPGIKTTLISRQNSRVKRKVKACGEQIILEHSQPSCDSESVCNDVGGRNFFGSGVPPKQLCYKGTCCPAREGDSYIDIDTGCYYIFKKCKWRLMPSKIGATGPQGPQGLLGATGPTGPTGPEGPRGFDGPQGPIGPTGPLGLSGFDGPQGMKGERGPQGMKGERGPQGMEGMKGITGPQAAIGSAVV